MSNHDLRLTISGRDHDTLAKALTYAIAFIQSLPEEDQETSDMQEMCNILYVLEENDLIKHVFNVERRTTKRANIHDNIAGIREYNFDKNHLRFYVRYNNYKNNFQKSIIRMPKVGRMKIKNFH